MTSNNVLQQLYDPLTTAPSTNCNGTGTANQFCRAPFSNNQIPVSRLDPTSKILYDMTPQPSNSSNPVVSSNLSVANPSIFIVPTITFRVDHSFSQKDKAYVRYTSNNQTNLALRNYPKASPATLAADGIPAGASGLQNMWGCAVCAAALNYTHVFSPHFLFRKPLRPNVVVLSVCWRGRFSQQGTYEKWGFQSAQ